MEYYTTLDYFTRLYDQYGRQHPVELSSQQAFSRWKQETRALLAKNFGMELCQKAPAEPRLLDTLDFDGYRREHWVIQTEPGVWMPFFLLKPTGEFHGGLILNPHGHGGGKENCVADPDNPGVTSRPDFGLKPTFAEEMARAGYYVACPDARGTGERREAGQQGNAPENWRTNSHREINQMALGFGMSMIGMMIWDLQRLLDYLLEQYPEIDPEKVGCAGMSGGGQQTLYLAAMDDRVKAAMTSGYFYGFRDALLRQPGNCSCNFAYQLWRMVDMGDLGAMIAPRPFFVESGRQDHLEGASGLDNVYSQVQIAREAFELFDCGNRLVHSVHEGGHQWVGVGVKEFFDRWLLGEE